MRRLAFALLVVTGCARHVVLDPAEVDRLNDRAWTVVHQPAPIDADAAAPITPPPAQAPATTAVPVEAPAQAPAPTPTPAD
jgi:hypothetical protein